MKNRTEEYWELIGRLAQPPKRLEGSVQRARKRARRTRLVRRLAAPVGTLAAAAACFVLMVNAFPTFALACSGLPLLRDLAAAAAFSPSLSAAVAHDYVQYIGQSQTINGVTVNLECVIADRAEAVFFYSVDGGRFYTSPGLIGLSGEHIGGYGVSSVQNSRANQDGLSCVALDFTDGNGLPGRFTMEMFFLPEEEQELAPEQTGSPAYAAPPETPVYSGSDEWGDPREDPGVLRFTFDVALDTSRIAQPVTVPVNRWMELDGQRILVDRMEYSPTRTILYLDEDDANTAWLKDIKFWFEDETGVRYDNIDGVLAARGAADSDSKSTLTYYFQSFYYSQPEGLVLCIGRAEWLDQDAPKAFINLATGESTGLPHGLEVVDIVRSGADVRVDVRAPLDREFFAQSFTSAYWDPEGGEHFCSRTAYVKEFDGSGSECAIRESLYLDSYPWDTVELEVRCTGISEYEQPVRVPLAPQS